MGLTKNTVGQSLLEADTIRRRHPNDAIIALAGNPNVGKSTVFNALTGMHQHTGNWPGKTVTSAQGYCKTDRRGYVLVDLPGTYSLCAHSAEEEVARDYICCGDPDAVVVICDATCLERNLLLVLQILEIGIPCAVCVNLLDEAKRKQITVDLPLLQERLSVPVVGISARKKKSVTRVKALLDRVSETSSECLDTAVSYSAPIEEAISIVEAALCSLSPIAFDTRRLALCLLEEDAGLTAVIKAHYNCAKILDDPVLQAALEEARGRLEAYAIFPSTLRDLTAEERVQKAEALARETVNRSSNAKADRDRKIDRILTGRLTGYPLMLVLLALVLWLTIEGANYPSAWLSAALFGTIERLAGLLSAWGLVPWAVSFLCDGLLRVPAWVISVMLPPMAIFFPLFTLLEDVGYLPRVAYNLDGAFQKCNACGKQALTMCMGFGCNAAGVVGCRIIDSPRERLMAVLTNSLVPCNGRFPALISIITLFLIGSTGHTGNSLLSALALTAMILLAILVTFGATKLLSKTLLSGVPSSFTLEMPPFRRPQVGQILVRSVFDRTLFVLGRSIKVAVPAGALIWILANVTVGNATLLTHGATLLDPLGVLLGMDGVILLAFVLGFPANEIVIPLAVMAYSTQSVLTEPQSTQALGALLTANGWTTVTALCVAVFFLFHWPCSTTLLTVKKETGSIKWTLLAAALPTIIGALLCFSIATAARILGV